MLAEHVVIVLVQPLHPGNVGGVARAMANFGLERLVLVDPPALDLERARWMASSGRRILDQARFVKTVDEALEGVTWAVGTTARRRRWQWPVVEPPGLAETVLAHGTERTTAILFGREDSGLDNASLAHCQALLRIPTAGEPSLNLSQAVLLLCARLHESARDQGWDPAQPNRQGKKGGGAPLPARKPRQRTPADLQRQSVLLHQTLDALERTAYGRGWSRELVQVTLGELLQRTEPSNEEIAMLMGMVKKVRWAIDHAPPDDE